MISLGAAFVRAALRAYTYPYRKRFASLSRSIALKNKPYVPPKGFAFAVEEYGGVRVEKVVPPECGRGAVLQFHGGGHTVPMNKMYRKAAERLAANCGCTVYSIDYHTGARLTYPALHDECERAYAALCKSALETVPGLQTVAVSEGTGAGSVSLNPDTACERIRHSAKQALTEGMGGRPALAESFFTEITYKTHHDAYSASYYPGAKQLAADTVGFEADDYYEVLRFLHFTA